MDESIIYDIWLSLAFMHRISYIEELMSQFGTAENIFLKGEKEIDFSRYGKTVESTFKLKDLSLPKDIYDDCIKNSIGIIPYTSDKYPSNMKTVDDPPVVLYYYGNAENLSKPLITITGTRKATREGLSDSAYFSAQIERAGIGIVSGFAEGIETEVFKNTVSPMIILPGGILKPFPKFNTKYIRKIIDRGGTLISEYPPMYVSHAFNFKYRNRILAAISDSTLIIESGIGSGTELTVNSCMAYGREVYALPGSIHSPKYEGNLKYIKNGAVLVTHPSEIIYDYYMKYPNLTLPVDEENNFEGMDENQIKIIKVLENSPLSTEEIIMNTGLDPSTVNILLISLEMSGSIRCIRSDCYEINRR